LSAVKLIGETGSLEQSRSLHVFIFIAFIYWLHIVRVIRAKAVICALKTFWMFHQRQARVTVSKSASI